MVDTSVLVDVALDDSVFGAASLDCLSRCRDEGLVIFPVTYVELAPTFDGNHESQQAFLSQLGVSWLELWGWQDTAAAYLLWVNHVAKKRAGQAGRRPVADVLIAAFAMRFQGIITRNPRDFAAVKVITP